MLTEGGVKSPSILFRAKRWTGIRRTNQMVHIIDWFPTLLDFAGLKIPENLKLDSVSQRKLFYSQNAVSNRDRFIYGIVDKLEATDGSIFSWNSYLKFYSTGGLFFLLLDNKTIR